jgi:DNA-binding FrmR family transcriptional regulator
MMPKKTRQHLHEDKQALKNRIRKISGQLKAIETMLDESRECPDILNQVVSARRALKSFAEKLIHEHTIHCIEDAQRDKGQEELKKLLLVLERYVE